MIATTKHKHNNHWIKNFYDMSEEYSVSHQDTDPEYIAKVNRRFEQIFARRKAIRIAPRIREEDTIAKRAKTIIKSTVESYKPDENTLTGKVYKILSEQKAPTHINMILERLSALESGWSHHKYSSVYKVLKNNIPLFEKTAPATFTIKVFQPPMKQNVIKFEVPKIPIPTTEAIVIQRINKFITKKSFTVRQAYWSVISSGYDISLSSIRRIVKSNFNRRGKKFVKV